jgi:hypothetical protein
MPTFHSGLRNRPNIAEANFDQIRICIKRAFVTPALSMNAYNSFKDNLGRCDETIFTQDHGERSHKFNVRKSIWFCGGTITFRKDRIDRQENGNRDDRTFPYVGDLDLYLNPTRFINRAVHAVEAPTRNPNPRGTPSGMMQELDVATVIRTPEPSNGLLRGLDGKDNIIPSTHYRHTRPALDIFDRYFESVLERIGENIEQALQQAMGREYRRNALLAPMEEWSVHHAEIYWEYAVSNATAFVHGLRGYLLPLFHDGETILYRASDLIGNDGFPRLSVYYNCPSLRVNLGCEDVDLVVYAKEYDRVRFEIRYGSKVRAKTTRTPQSRFDGQALSGVPQLLNLAILNARKRLRKVMDRLPELDYSERCTFHHLIDFLYNLAEACHETSDVRGSTKRILSQLVSNGGISVQVSSVEHDFCEALRTRRMLKQVRAMRNERGVRRYSLPPSYFNVIQAVLETVEQGERQQPRRRSRETRRSR